MKTYNFGQIDWTGFKSTLKHLAWGAVVFGLYFLYMAFKGHDFGVYTVITGPMGVFIAANLKKLAETYSVALPDTTVEVTEDTGAIAPETPADTQ